MASKLEPTLQDLRDAEERYQNRYQRTGPTKLTDLAEKIQMPPKPQAQRPAVFTPTQDVVVLRKFPLLIPYRDETAQIDGRRLFAAILENVEDVITQRTGQTFRFSWSEHQVPVIAGLIKHAINDPSGPYRLHKGIYLWGDMRKGKTTLLKCIRALLANIAGIKGTVPFKDLEFTDVTEMYETLGGTWSWDISQFTQADRILDDVGRDAELQPLHLNKKEVMPLQAILWARARRWQEYGQLTHFTSNLPWDDILKGDQVLAKGWVSRFEPRLAARLKEMTTPVLFPS